MKKWYHILWALLAVACSKGESAPPQESADQETAYTAIVTQKRDAQMQVYFQLDDNTIIYPVNFTDAFSGMRRLICGITVDGSSCYIHWMDYLAEAQFVASASIPDDGIDVQDDWMTSVEDGYLTVHYFSWWGDGSTPHSLQVVQGEHPYELNLRHSRNGDDAYEWADGLVYFDINSLPSTQGDYVTLTLNWTTGEGKAASKRFRFRTRQ